MNEPAATSSSVARALVGLLIVVVLIAAGWWLFQDRDNWPRGEALVNIPRRPLELGSGDGCLNEPG